MSSQDESPDVDHDRSSKKRKIQRACDYCRRKKIKCDGPRMPNNRCSKCIYRKTECTYVEPLHKDYYPSSYVQTLESRMHKMEALVQKMCPDSDLSKDLDEILDKETPSQQSISSRHGVGTPLGALGTSTASAGSPLSTAPTPPQSAGHPSSDAEPEMPEHLIEGMINLSIRPSNIRYHGESSGLVFLRSALGMKQVYGGGERDKPLQDVLRNSRAVQDSWEAPVYERPFPPNVFPSPDLMTALIELYFIHVNAFTPLLHRPSFEHAVSDGLHLRSQGFGSVLLLVCACASRFTDDPRAYINPTERHSAGWRWYLEAEGVHKSTIAPAELYDLQKAVLMAQFLQNSTGPHTSWTVIGLGLRKAVEAGVHRRRVYKELTPDDELWRRAFWALVTMDWINGHGLGRPCSIRDEDMDTNLPTECDDEYWTAADPKDAFKQPLGKPSRVTAFNLLIRLVQIIAYASRTIFSANPPRSKPELRGQDWEQRIVAELDSALNRWAASIPDHLRWDPKREDPLWLAQSAMLYAGYYQTQITVHRAFILSKRDRIFPFPSIIICANAARSCIRVLRQYFERTGTPGYQNAGALFAASTILMINIWAEKRAGRENNAAKDLVDVRSTLDMLLAAEPHYHAAGKLWDIVYNLSSTETPSPEVSQTGSAQQAGPSSAAPASSTTSTTETRACAPSLPSFTPQEPTPEYAPGPSQDPSTSFAGISPMSGTSFSMAEGMTGWMYGTPLNTGEFSGDPARAAAAFPPWASWPQGSVSQWPPHQAPHGPFPAQSNAPHAQMYTQSDQLTADGDATRFAFSGDQVPGLHPIGCDAPLPTFTYNVSTRGTEGGDPRERRDGTAETQAEETPDFAFFDDASSLLSLFPPYSGSGLDDWGAYFNSSAEGGGDGDGSAERSPQQPHT